jgi:hypothetical protein
MQIRLIFRWVFACRVAVALIAMAMLGSLDQYSLRNNGIDRYGAGTQRL